MPFKTTAYLKFNDIRKFDDNIAESTDTVEHIVLLRNNTSGMLAKQSA